jgi:hypothetical protein
MILVYTGPHQVTLVPYKAYDIMSVCFLDLPEEQRKTGLPMVCMKEGKDV